ncbi:23S rRNA (uracil(1939)-C(5))-methyltransferase RlmD [Pseudidiomarina gelatinasegens]|jgi:23S rRNA (uracil1939-C5)-methyltransferase|uniref:23S rRNA (uracil(1939)-C(5))-methyltransferase RlmD n=1 Tax=Pseudidiomarina gelatinasegens TaxID=2487740 RepID=UPI003A96FF38
MAQIYKPQPRQVKAEALKQQLVVGLDHQGRGVVRTPKGARFVGGALPGEVISLMPRGKYEAELIDITEASSERVMPPCAYYASCGGCDLQHLELHAQRRHKQQVVEQMLQKFAQLSPEQWLEPLTDNAWNYRRRARLAVHYDRKRQQLKLGFRAAKSKQIVAINDCLTLTKSLNDLLKPLRTLLPKLSLVRQLGHVELIDLNPKPIVLLRVETAPVEADTQALQLFAEQYSVAIWLATEHSVKPLNAHDATVSYQTLGAALHCKPNDFLQTHQQLSEKMVAQALIWLAIEPQDTILELYAGSGNFTIPMALQGAQVTAVEGVHSMVEQLAENAKRYAVKVNAVCANLEQPWPQQGWAGSKFDQPFTKVLLDPARAGAPHAIGEVAKRQPQRIVYVSCAPDTLARDANVLKQNGYQLKRAQVIDMFPQTHHIEVITLFERE